MYFNYLFPMSPLRCTHVARRIDEIPPMFLFMSLRSMLHSPVPLLTRRLDTPPPPHKMERTKIESKDLCSMLIIRKAPSRFKVFFPVILCYISVIIYHVVLSGNNCTTESQVVLYKIMSLGYSEKWPLAKLYFTKDT